MENARLYRDCLTTEKSITIVIDLENGKPANHSPTIMQTMNRLTRIYCLWATNMVCDSIDKGIVAVAASRHKCMQSMRMVSKYALDYFRLKASLTSFVTRNNTAKNNTLKHVNQLFLFCCGCCL